MKCDNGPCEQYEGKTTISCQHYRNCVKQEAIDFRREGKVCVEHDFKLRLFDDKVVRVTTWEVPERAKFLVEFENGVYI